MIKKYKLKVFRFVRDSQKRGNKGSTADCKTETALDITSLDIAIQKSQIRLV